MEKKVRMEIDMMDGGWKVKTSSNGYQWVVVFSGRKKDATIIENAFNRVFATPNNIHIK